MNLPTDRIFSSNTVSITEFYVKFYMWFFANNRFDILTSPTNGEVVGICCRYIEFLLENDCIKIVGTGTLAMLSYTEKKIPIFTN